MKKIIFFAIIALLLAACKDEIPPEIPEKPKNMEFYDARWAMYYGFTNYSYIVDTIIANKDGSISDGHTKSVSLTNGTWEYYPYDESVIIIKYMRSSTMFTVWVNYEIDSLTFTKFNNYSFRDLTRIQNINGKRIEDF
jgi:hypothetical protein